MRTQVTPGQKIIGLSVSLCITDIINGHVNVDDVVKIIGSTRARNDDEWNAIIEIYKENYWRDKPAESEQLIRTFIAEKRVEQPRLQHNGHMPAIYDSIWVTSEDEIRWVDEPELV